MVSQSRPPISSNSTDRGHGFVCAAILFLGVSALSWWRQVAVLCYDDGLSRLMMLAEVSLVSGVCGHVLLALQQAVSQIRGASKLPRELPAQSFHTASLQPRLRELLVSFLSCLAAWPGSGSISTFFKCKISADTRSCGAAAK